MHLKSLNGLEAGALCTTRWSGAGDVIAALKHKSAGTSGLDRGYIYMWGR
jgi:hypothetical protein